MSNTSLYNPYKGAVRHETVFMNTNDHLRTGYTTGSCACAAAKAALTMLLRNRQIETITITLPSGKKVEFPVSNTLIHNGTARCAVVKDSGDDPDVTNGLSIFADVSIKRRKGVQIEGGEGIGKVTKPGLQIPVGESAINPVPRKMIISELEDLLDAHECHKGVHVIISVPGGEKIAEKTFNPKLGIIGGISIIGTTGVVKPYSVPAIKKSLLLFVDQAKALGHNFIVLVPGNIGEKAAHKQYFLNTTQVAQMSNYVGFMVKKSSLKFDKILIVGHPGKLLKIILGCFTTHSQKSISPVPWLQKQVLACPRITINKQDIIISPTVEGIISCIPAGDRLSVFSPMASRIEKKLRGYTTSPVNIGVVLTDMDGNCIGCSDQVRYWEEHGFLKLRR